MPKLKSITNFNFLNLRNNTRRLKTIYEYYYQTEGQMEITGSLWCDLFIWCKDDIERMNFNPEKMARDEGQPWHILFYCISFKNVIDIDFNHCKTLKVIENYILTFFKFVYNLIHGTLPNLRNAWRQTIVIDHLGDLIVIHYRFLKINFVFKLKLI